MRAVFFSGSERSCKKKKNIAILTNLKMLQTNNSHARRRHIKNYMPQSPYGPPRIRTLLVPPIGTCMYHAQVANRVGTKSFHFLHI